MSDLFGDELASGFSDYDASDDLFTMSLMDDYETNHMIATPRAIRRAAKHAMLKTAKEQELADLLVRLPDPGESIHCVSNGTLDYYLILPAIANRLPIVEFYGSTWVMNRENINDLLGLYDSGKIQKITMLTGEYFKRRSTAEANTLITGLAKRGQRYKAFKNHAKVMLIQFDDKYIVCEGSANFTANPRLEQSCITHSQELYEFYRAIFEEYFK